LGKGGNLGRGLSQVELARTGFTNFKTQQREGFGDVTNQGLQVGDSESFKRHIRQKKEINGQ